MVAGPIPSTVAVLEELAAADVPLWALTNWSAETFALVRDDPAYAFLDHFRTIFVSGELRLIKPDPAIYRHVLGAIDAPAGSCLFIDDAPKNVAGAAALGIQTHQFTGAGFLTGGTRRLGPARAGLEAVRRWLARLALALEAIALLVGGGAVWLAAPRCPSWRGSGAAGPAHTRHRRARCQCDPALSAERGRRLPDTGLPPWPGPAVADGVRPAGGPGPIGRGAGRGGTAARPVHPHARATGSAERAAAGLDAATWRCSRPTPPASTPRSRATASPCRRSPPDPAPPPGALAAGRQHALLEADGAGSVEQLAPGAAAGSTGPTSSPRTGCSLLWPRAMQPGPVTMAALAGPASRAPVRRPARPAAAGYRLQRLGRRGRADRQRPPCSPTIRIWGCRCRANGISPIWRHPASP